MNLIGKIRRRNFKNIDNPQTGRQLLRQEDTEGATQAATVFAMMGQGSVSRVQGVTRGEHRDNYGHLATVMVMVMARAAP